MCYYNGYNPPTAYMLNNISLSIVIKCIVNNNLSC